MNDEGASREITITRIFDAPRDLVFKAWTGAEHLAKWWGPEGFSVAEAESDARPGGALTIVMRGPDGTDFPMTGRYREVTAPERLVIESAVVGEAGRRLLEAVTTVTFADLGGKTQLTVHERGVALVPEAVPMLGGMHAGMNQSLQRLDDVLTGAVDRQVVIMRLFQAPRERVFDAWTQREHVERWWGPAGFSVTTDEMDVRPGGTWRFTMHGPQGNFPNQIVYHEITQPSRLVYTHTSPGVDDPRFRTTVTFDDWLGMTAFTMRLVFDSAGERDVVVEKYNAVEGGNQTLDRLGELLAAMAPA
jgi:uncharacterized protein YndB with AHSA1/START domain